jgi:hypothetical protein
MRKGKAREVERAGSRSLGGGPFPREHTKAASALCGRRPLRDEIGASCSPDQAERKDEREDPQHDHDGDKNERHTQEESGERAFLQASESGR